MTWTCNQSIVPPVKEDWVFKRTPQFRRAFDGLSPTDQEAAREAFKIFKQDPFDARLRPHKINRLSALRKRTVHSVTIANNLRAVFEVHGNIILSLDIGTHDIYK